MNPKLYFTLLLISLASMLQAQLQTTGHTIIGSVKTPSYSKLQRRSLQNPTSCITDTVSFTRQGSTAFNTITIANGRSLGQFFSAPQSLTIHGFDFFAYAVTPSPPRDLKINVRCHIYKAGLDSLPTGAPLASDTVELDTVRGSNILLSRIIRRAHFKTPITLNYNYVVVLECDSTNVNAAMVTNSWANGDGDGRNLGCGSINNVWYRCLNLNVSGVTFDCHMQFYPYVKYDFGTDFIVKNPCHKTTDTVRFENQAEKNVCGSEFYNFYKYLGYENFCHLWRYSNSFSQYAIHGKYKYPSPSNENVKLQSRLYQWSTGMWCRDTQNRDIAFKPDNPTFKSELKTCMGDTFKLELNKRDNYSKPYWHTDPNKSPFDSGYIRTLAHIQKNDSFSVQLVNKNCKSSFAKRVLEVHEYPDITLVKDDSICIGAVANLSVGSDTGELYWYKVQTGGLTFYQGKDYQTQALSRDTFFYVEGNNNGCKPKTGRVKVNAFVSNSYAPELPVTSNDTILCSPYSQLDLQAMGSHTLRWYNNAVGGTPQKVGSNYSVNPQSKGKYKFYVENWNGVCGSGRKEINVTVNKALQLPVLDPIVICAGESATFTHTLPYGDVMWFDSATQINPSAFGLSYHLNTPVKSRNVYYKHKDNECISPNLVNSTVVVNHAPTPNKAAAPAVCYKGQGLFEVLIPEGTVHWFKEESDTGAFASGSQVLVPKVLSNITYYYQTKNKGCKSDKKPLTLISKPRPVAGFSYELFWQNRFRGTPVNATNTSFFWDFGDGNTSTKNIPLHQYATSGKYTVTQIATSQINGCTDTVAIPVNISHVGIAEVSNDAVLFPNPIKNGQELQILDSKTVWKWRLYDMQGRLVDELQGKTFLVNGVTNGVYIIHCSNAAQSTRTKIHVNP